MRILTYLEVPRTFPPTTGCGRHANEMVRALGRRPDVQLEALCSAEHIGADGRIDPRCPHHHLPARTFPWPERRAERLWKLTGRPRLDRFVGDVDLVYSPFEALLPVKVRPWVFTIHDVHAYEPDALGAGGWRHRVFRWRMGLWTGRALRQARLIATSSEFSKARLVALLGAEPKKVVVVGNGVDERFHALAKVDPATLPRPCPEPYVLVVGGLIPHKGGDVVLKVAAELSARGSRIRVVVAGRSYPHLEAAAAAHPNVRLLGRVPDDQLLPLLRGALASMLMSYYEGFGLPPLEAMAAGVPAVVSDRGSLPEVVGDAAVVVPIDAPGRAADELIELDRSPAARAEWIGRGFRRAAGFTWEDAAGRLVDAARRVC